MRTELNAEVTGVEQRGGGVAVKINRAGVPGEVTGSHLLLAIGRVPNTHDLALDRAGVATDARGYIQAGGDEAIHCVIDAMYANAPYPVVQRAVHIHPTVSELLPTLLGELKQLR